MLYQALRNRKKENLFRPASSHVSGKFWKASFVESVEAVFQLDLFSRENLQLIDKNGFAVTDAYFIIPKNKLSRVSDANNEAGGSAASRPLSEPSESGHDFLGHMDLGLDKFKNFREVAER
ncbi:hypothetical protein CERZMDRAFT_104051 [Cercospora zeae-maydis SCOH1-5]|uniref:Uncharacterized protein n=1 Tax=Cercospora zeae-maydis SCOH1-5 TaxID=717836 RepID=A0A6A6EYC1_9PEZI|nr:hypothetical protein CERZMDRAFT_104051 [Cercospora zeae-maydis SCOH1-5]